MSQVEVGEISAFGFLSDFGFRPSDFNPLFIPALPK
jgi:hypothetical protein